MDDPYNFLSGADLWNHKSADKKVDESLGYSNNGMKHEDADNTFLQAKQLEFVHKRYVQQISHERVEKVQALCIGEYDCVKNKVKIEKLKGKVWSSFGHADNGHLSLYPEEALFLMDTSILQVLFKGLPLSIQEAYDLFFSFPDEKLTLAHYVVYSYLCRLGYIVQRRLKAQVHSESLMESGNTRDIKKRKAADSQELQLKTLKATHLNDSVDDADDNLGLIESIESGPSPPRFDFNEIVLPPDQPSSSQPGYRFFSFHSLMDYRCTQQKETVNNWDQFKLKHQKRLTAMTQSIAYSDESDIPLVKMSDRVDVACILDKLQLSETVSLDQLSNSRPHHDEFELLMFDVFQPQSKFKKTNPGRPHFRYRVISAEEDPPDLPGIMNLVTFEDSVPFYWAVCDGGDVSFYHYQQECIPPDLYKSFKL